MNDEVVRYVKTIQQKTAWEIKVLNMGKEFSFDNQVSLGESIGPGEWLSYIKNASYVVTNSFHGMVFSLTYRRPFTAFKRQERDFRQLNLVVQFGVEERLLDGYPKSGCDPFDKTIDWDLIISRRGEISKESIAFLRENV